MSFDAYTFVKKFDHTKLASERAIDACIVNHTKQITYIEFLRDQQPSKDQPTRLAELFPFSLDGKNFTVEGNGKTYVAAVGPTESKEQAVLRVQSSVATEAIKIIRDRIHFLHNYKHESIPRFEQATSRLAELEETLQNPTLTTLLKGNLLRPNPDEPNTFCVVKSLKHVLEQFDKDQTNVNQSYVEKLFRKRDGTPFTKESIRVELLKSRDRLPKADS